MKFCNLCKTYTLRDQCVPCGKKTVRPYPMKFSPQDPYGKYRRQLKKEDNYGEKKNSNR
jgi:H/ACA ribonucleoprotein complex subunit 3